MKNFDKELEAAADKLSKGKKAKKKKSSEPTTAAGWLREAYIDGKSSDGAPKVGKIGYV
tara:strand:+ start:170 stop:346 length:177 start_codon:yes stop_codon:yes gene_type:complete